MFLLTDLRLSVKSNVFPWHEHGNLGIDREKKVCIQNNHNVLLKAEKYICKCD